MSARNPSQNSGAPRPAGGPRWNHLAALWEAALALDPLPQFDRWLAGELKRRPQFGRRDRGWYRERLFGALRHGVWALLVEWVARRDPEASADATPGWPAVMERFCAEYPDYAAVRAGWRRMGAAALFGLTELKQIMGELVGDAPARDMIEAALRLRYAVETPGAPLALRCAEAGVPAWWAAALEQRAAMSQWSDEDVGRFLERLATRPPVWLRVNRPDELDERKRALRSMGFHIEAEDGPALAVSGPRNLASMESFLGGAVAIQDWASQQAGRRVAARPGDVVWDCCAGGGGKTLQIAAALAGSGIVIASDVRARMLGEVQRRAREAGFANVRTLPWDGGDALPDFGREAGARGGCDWVLVDAPCSSAGVWRRSPDAMFRVRPEDAAALAAVQRQILDRAARSVRPGRDGQPGGALVYVTCSWLVEENEAVARAFAASHPEFHLESMTLLGNPHADSDTLFAAVFRRVR